MAAGNSYCLGIKSNDFFLKDNKKAFILWLNVPKVTAYGCSEDKFRKVISILAETGTLPPEYKPHPLKSNYKGCMECHITSDWLLVWKQNDKELILILTDTGTHSDIFGW